MEVGLKWVIPILLLASCYRPDYTTSHGTYIENTCSDVPTPDEMEFHLDFMLEHGESCWPVDIGTMVYVLADSRVILVCDEFTCFQNEKCKGLWQFSKFSVKSFKHTAWWYHDGTPYVLYHELMHSFLFVLFDGAADPDGNHSKSCGESCVAKEYWDGVECLTRMIVDWRSE